jgi:hypothetical protein
MKLIIKIPIQLNSLSYSYLSKIESRFKRTSIWISRINTETNVRKLIFFEDLTWNTGIAVLMQEGTMSIEKMFNTVNVVQRVLFYLNSPRTFEQIWYTSNK